MFLTKVVTNKTKHTLGSIVYLFVCVFISLFIFIYLFIYLLCNHGKIFYSRTGNRDTQYISDHMISMTDS